MIERIYTIPVNESFDAADGCPFCGIYKKLESNELDIILGASMMEPDIRIKTNALGFCGKHYKTMLTMKNRLGLALMLESHFGENIIDLISKKGIADMLGGDKGRIEKLDKQTRSCYICSRIEFSFERMLECAALLWHRESEFKKKLDTQPYFCLPHYAALLEAALRVLPKKVYPGFAEKCRDVTAAYAKDLLEDISWFVKKFDYRYENEPWGTAKDSPERAVRFLCSDE